jgi:hypothetical protein
MKIEIMSSVRETIEWSYKDTGQLFSFPLLEVDLYKE